MVSEQMTSGRIPQTFINDLVSRADIVDIIGARIPLKKTGRNYWARCPFHNEKTPSFSVNSDKQFYQCFGCGVHGTVISFLMDYDHLEFPEAVEELARGLGLSVPREAGSAKATGSRRDLPGWLEEAARYYQRMLAEHPEAETARAYLTRRGLNAAAIARFRIGYAPSGWDNLLVALGGESAREPLLEAGMLTKKEDTDRMYDRFRGRIMFPIENQRGQIIGFGGRSLNDDPPKYLNSPETPIFHKGRELYGLHQAVEHTRSPECLLVVEGYMDVVALAQYGISYAVATLGTATTTDHLRRLFRITSRVVFCFDGDKAGRTAAWRALEASLPELRDQHDIRFLLLPEGEDPDTLVRGEGLQAFTARIQQATPVIEYLLATLQAQISTNKTDRQAQVLERARPLVAKLSSDIYRALLVRELAELAEISPDKLSTLMQASPTAPKPAPKEPRKGRQGQAHPSPMRTAVGLLLARPELAKLAGDPVRFAGWGIPGASLLAEILTLLQTQPNLKSAAILEHWRGTETERYLVQLAQWTPLVPPEGMAIELQDALERLEQQALEQETARLVEKSHVATLTEAEKVQLRILCTRKSARTTPPPEIG